MTTPREIVFDAIQHRQPAEVPYTLGFESEVDKPLNADSDVEARLDDYYGGPHWRERLKRYMTGVGAVDTDKKEAISAERWQDAYGGIWRIDRLPWHLETPPLKTPSFEGYTFPSPEVFYRPDWKANAYQTIEENQDTFIVGNLGWGLFERCWNLRGFENILMDAVENPDFFEEALDKIMNLYLNFVDYTCELPSGRHPVRRRLGRPARGDHRSEALAAVPQAALGADLRARARARENRDAPLLRLGG